MASAQQFSNAWGLRFPNDPCPNFRCLEDGYNNHDEIKTLLKGTKSNIQDLKIKLEQKEFIASFLWDLLYAMPSRNGSNHNCCKESEDTVCGYDDELSIGSSVSSFEMRSIADIRRSNTLNSNSSYGSRDSSSSIHSHDSSVSTNKPCLKPKPSLIKGRGGGFGSSQSLHKFTSSVDGNTSIASCEKSLYKPALNDCATDEEKLKAKRRSGEEMGILEYQDSPEVSEVSQCKSKENIYETIKETNQNAPDSRIKSLGDSAESSSDEDEPIYSNIILLNEHLRNNSAIIADQDGIYATIKGQKKRLKDQAMELGRRFSFPVGTSTVVCSSPRVPSLVREDSEVQNEQEDDIPDGSLHGSAESSAGPFASSEPVDHMRKWILSSIVEGEEAYVSQLNSLLYYCRSLEGAAKSSQPLLPTESINTIFYLIPDIHQLHVDFLSRLKPIVNNWESKAAVGSIIHKAVIKDCDLATKYLQNYVKAQQTIQQFCESCEDFANLAKSVPVQHSSNKTEKQSLQELLHKPVVRIQRNTLALHDLLSATPESHPDFPELEKTYKVIQDFLDSFQKSKDASNSKQSRYLVKNGLVVQLVNAQRKLRHVFLFTDVLVCAKQKISAAGRKLQFDIKWMIALEDIILDEANAVSEDNERHMQAVESRQQKIGHLQRELRTLLKKSREEIRNSSVRSSGKVIEKLKKRLLEQETEMALQAPYLPLVVKRSPGKEHTMLLSSDYERTEWRNSIQSHRSKAVKEGQRQSPNFPDIQHRINLLELPKVADMSTLLEQEYLNYETENLFGSLQVTIHQLEGVLERAEYWCTVEVDSLAQFLVRAQTTTTAATEEPTWNENFDVDLEGAQTFRLLCYCRKLGGEEVLIGKCAIELGKSWLRGNFTREALLLVEGVSVTVTLKYVSREQIVSRTRSALKTGVFGIQVTRVAKRECRLIPLIVTACVEEIERRGIDDLGIYRVSGLSSEVQTLKKSFDKNSRAAAESLKSCDIHVVTNLLKLYLRELPEPLFCQTYYDRFVNTLEMSEEVKQKCQISLLQEMPKTNQATILFLIDHMITISRNELKNKMSVHNLATVFGPTLLGMLSENKEFCVEAREMMCQTSILYSFILMRRSGVLT